MLQKIISFYIFARYLRTPLPLCTAPYNFHLSLIQLAGTVETCKVWYFSLKVQCFTMVDGKFFIVVLHLFSLNKRSFKLNKILELPSNRNMILYILSLLLLQKRKYQDDQSGHKTIITSYCLINCFILYLPKWSDFIFKT